MARTKGRLRVTTITTATGKKRKVIVDPRGLFVGVPRKKKK